jgi:formylglycine-generating enzyme required for sulfatase activity
MLELLHDRERYATLDRDAVAVLCDLVAERGVVPAAFQLVKIERFECGGAANWMAVYHHTLTGLDFSLIPGGTFLMGSPVDEADRDDDETQHLVTLTRPFLMCQTTCTQAAWGLVGRRKNPSEFKGGTLPVETVSWNDATAWCEKAGLVLPTEAQWEYACRAGTTGPFCYGDSLDASVANFDGECLYGSGAVGEYRATTTPAGSFTLNAFGLSEVHGNVWEWCSNWYTNDLDTAAVRDPAGPATGWKRVYRGGGGGNVAGNCRSALRGRSDPGNRNSYIGFRPSRPLSSG